MKPRKWKRKIHFRIMLLSDSSEGNTHQFYIGKGFAAVVSFLLAVCIVLTSYVTYAMTNRAENTKELRDRVSQLAVENKSLVTQNTELAEKVSILSQTVNEKVQEAEEAAEKSLPRGFPLSGAAAIQDSGENTAEGQDTDSNPIVVFVAGTGISVIATGNATIQSIEEDSVYGYLLKLDHGNGYVSIYRNQSEPKVKQGDEVTKGTMLFELTGDNQKLGYQIMKDGEYIDPLEMMEIYG